MNIKQSKVRIILLKITPNIQNSKKLTKKMNIKLIGVLALKHLITSSIISIISIAIHGVKKKVNSTAKAIYTIAFNLSRLSIEEIM